MELSNNEIINLSEHWSEICAAVYELCENEPDNIKANSFLDFLSSLSEEQEDS